MTGPHSSLSPITDSMNNDNNDNRGYPWLAIFLAVAIVGTLSFVPWSDITDGYIKDYNLLADITHQEISDTKSASNDIVDPELLSAMQELDDAVPSDAPAANADTVFVAQSGEFTENPGRVNGEMVIEDYTEGTRGLANLRHALNTAGSARIAVVGDSYIEGDIFTQDMRNLLQNQYGGRGVGFVPAFSSIPGFRRTVNVNGSDGWTEHSISKGKEDYFALASQYFVGSNGASVKYSGYKRDPKIAAWNTSSVLFIAPSDGTLTIFNDVDTLTVDITASTAPQFVTLSGETTKFTVKSNVPGLVYLGAWLEDRHGVTVDCMSVRGDSGITHRRLNSSLSAEMRKYIDYDLIILEYGINALSATQTDYSGYAKLMKEVVNKVRECYPDADILLMGVGDRGQKIDGAVRSMPTIRNMVENQRRLASETGCLFWDTREAMGGEDAIADWRERKLVNGDYIHLNSDGGRELATLLVNSINAKLGE